jgi:hypothetical protein
MKKRLGILLFILLLLAGGLPARAQTLTRDQVVQRYQEAMYPPGLSFERMYAEMELEINGELTPASFWMTVSGNMRLELEVSTHQMIATVNETSGWSKVGKDAPTELSLAERSTFLRNWLERFRPDRWRKFINDQTTYQGLDTTLGYPAHLLLVPVLGELKTMMDDEMETSDTSGLTFSDFRIFLDPATFHVIELRRPFALGGQTATSIIRMKGYTVVDGFPIPTEMSFSLDVDGTSQTFQIVRFRQVNINQPMPASLFAKPE